MDLPSTVVNEFLFTRSAWFGVLEEEILIDSSIPQI